MNTSKKKYTLIDLFAGCGGLSLGFQNAVFSILAAFDNWDEAIEVYRQIFRHPIFKKDLSDVSSIEDISKCQPLIIIGGSLDVFPHISSDRAVSFYRRSMLSNQQI